jgi:hypothetical protein
MSKLSFTIGKELQHHGICDASGSVALDDNRFIVANDEDNLLRVYSADESGHSLAIIDINDYFPNNPKKKEVDIEAATELNGNICWITSHGRNKDKERKPRRHQFFANKITNFSKPTLEQVRNLIPNWYLRICSKMSNLKTMSLKKPKS